MRGSGPATAAVIGAWVKTSRRGADYGDRRRRRQEPALAAPNPQEYRCYGTVDPAFLRSRPVPYGTGTRMAQKEGYLMSQSRAWNFVRSLALGFALMVSARPVWSAVDGTWSALGGGGSAPSPRREYAAVYDQANQRYLIFGGLYRDFNY